LATIKDKPRWRANIGTNGAVLMRILAVICLPLLIIGLSGVENSAWAEIYQWKDADGVTHYSDTRPANQPSEQTTLQINKGMRFATEEQMLETLRRRSNEADRIAQEKQAAKATVKVSPQDREDAKSIAAALAEEEALKKAVKNAGSNKVKERKRAIFRAQQSK
jgi:cell division protein FtsX